MATMANYWARKGWPITLITFDDGSVPPFFPLDSRIRHISLGVAGDSPHLLHALRNNWRRLRSLRRAIRDSQPQAVLSFLDKVNVTTILATRGLGLPVLVSERIDPHYYAIGAIWTRLRRWTYPLAQHVVVQSQGARDYFLPALRSTISIVPNPVHTAPGGAAPPAGPAAKRVVMGMGRLERQKGFDLLIRAFARLKDRYPDWHLTILGDGPLRAELEALSDDLLLAGRVRLPGQVGDVYAELRQATIFVLASRFEGFPNALCEAMACGLPVIATDCPSGPAQIIRNGIDGRLVPREDVDALAAVLGELMADPAERSRLAARAPEVTERFGLEKVMALWEDILDQVAR